MTTLSTKIVHRFSLPALNKHLRCSPGFTLIEVIVVIAVLGALMVIAYPALSKWVPNYQLKAAAQELYGNLQKAKLHAVKTNREVTFNFTTSADCSAATRYTFTDQDGRTVASVDMQGGGVCIQNSTFMATSGFSPQGLALDLPAANKAEVKLSHAKLFPSRIHTITQTMPGSISIN